MGLKFINAAIGQLICNVVFTVTAVTLNPTPVYLMFADNGIEFLPKIDIFNWLFGCGLLAPLFPIGHPLLNTLKDIGGV